MVPASLTVLTIGARDLPSLRDFYKRLGKHYDTRQVIDLVFAVGQYTLVSMALNSFGVQIES